MGNGLMPFGRFRKASEGFSRFAGFRRFQPLRGFQEGPERFQKVSEGLILWLK